MGIKITDVRAVSLNLSSSLNQTVLSAGCNLTVVRVDTDQPGLYGLGCATFTYRWKAVECVVNEYFKPLLVGRDAENTEELFQLMNNNSYWRNGPVTNNAISGVDMALWDIKGKAANMPVYSLLGGKCREAALIYRHADGPTPEAAEENVRKFMEEGVTHIRIQCGGYGGKPEDLNTPAGSQPGVYYDPDQYFRKTLALFEHMRKHVGWDVEFLHDTHERLPAIQSVQLAKELEPYRPFFLEDILSPEQGEWFRMVRANCTTPIANGELYNNPREWEDLISDRLIDFIRCHISQIGGITPAKKLAVFAEVFGVRTAWHGPGDVSPIGHAANLHLDLSCPNFGIQEWCGFPDLAYEIFPGMPYAKNGYLYGNDRPGLGVDFNEDLAKLHPPTHTVTEWTQTRLPDGTAHTP